MTKNYFLLFFLLISGTAKPQSEKAQSTEAIAELVLERGLKEVDLGIYGGTLFMHGMSELAVLQKDPKNLNRTLEIFNKFKTKEIKEFADYETEKFVLVKAKSGQPITYYMGAGWTKNPHFKTKQEWLNYVNKEILKVAL